MWPNKKYLIKKPEVKSYKDWVKRHVHIWVILPLIVNLLSIEWLEAISVLKPCDIQHKQYAWTFDTQQSVRMQKSFCSQVQQGGDLDKLANWTT